MQEHVVPTHIEEDGGGSKEEPKDHSSRTADFSCVLGSKSLKIKKQALWKGCTKKALIESNQQMKASGVCQTSLELWSDETKIELFGHVHHWQKRDAYKE